MPIRYKIDILQALKDTGFTTYKIRKENIFGQATMQKIRRGEIVNTTNLEKLCELLNCQPGDIIEYVADPPASEEE